MSATILIVEDDAVFSDLLETILSGAGYTVSKVPNGYEALKLLQKTIFDIVISDLKMPVIGGIELFEKSQLIEQRPLFIFITAFGKIEEAVNIMKMGGFDFLTKPLESPKALLAVVSRAVDAVKLNRVIFSFEELERGSLPPKDLIFAGTSMKSVEKLVADVAKTSATVLLTGESGTGKEVIAKAIHFASDRKREPFVTINAAAIPENLLESELFGHEKGSFTGALNCRRGKFELAQKGTIFLDEIGEMPLLLQAKLLRVLQEKSFERVGSEKSIKADVRVIAATNRNLALEVEAKRFREDLFYRLNVFPIKLPPLRERKDAIENLIFYFISRFSISNSKKNLKIDKDALKILIDYEWRGNVRELQNVIERAVILAESEIKINHLPEDIKILDDKNNNREITLKNQENELVAIALSKFNGNRKRAAESLGISLRTLQYRIKELGIGRSCKS